MKAKEAYKEVFKVLKKHKETCIFDIDRMKDSADRHLWGLELKEAHGLNVNPLHINSLDWNKFGEYMSISKYGEKYSRTISWPVDGNQPVDETLLQISFPTGAFIFGDGGMFNKDYPTEFFAKFWTELKSYKPDYIDEHNHGVYWNVKNAKEIFNSFDSILKRFQELNGADIKERRIAKMEEELNKLKGV